MLVKRKEEYELYQEQSISESAARIEVPKLNVALRSKCLILVALFAVMAMITTVRSEAIVSNGYALVQTKSQINKLEKNNEQLKLEIARLKSPQRIKSLAAEKLQMVVPEEVYFASKNAN
ncbi:septum formation initiator family protein [Anaerosinus gibii]|uniref:Cell division protein FtsL n=1 Tax=Selenobaculum gibii TaxID=3054208 RepID=A0A9Y2AK85_9FIRM|nr:cell division protein FtsL [Selenobaculum gbiensis]WIW71666.1 cell division protein FtsL [Selenobaculum gbiensis]